MKVFLVRHADADAEIPEGLSDDERPLTTRGRAAVAGHFAGLKDRLGSPAAIWMSPLVRAVQTGQILALTLGHEGPLKVTRALIPEMPVGALDALLADRTGPGLVLIGHQPSIGAMAAHLMGLTSLQRSVTPGTDIALELPDGAGSARLLFFASPGQPILEEV
jgi:phosphohistidine phosphatase